MLNWMQSFGQVRRIGIERTGTYGAGLLRYFQQFDVEILEVTTPDKMDLRRRGKNDTVDAENAAHAAFAGIHTVTPKTPNGMIESLRVLKVCRKTAIAVRRIALQMIQMNIISVPEPIREQLRTMIGMQLIRTLATWRPNLGGVSKHINSIQNRIEISRTAVWNCRMRCRSGCHDLSHS